MDKVIKTIKKSLPLRKVKFKDKLFDVIKNTNLFIYNIYSFIELYYIIENPNYKLESKDLMIIFDILKTGVNYHDTNHKFHKFYIDTYQKHYFNPDAKNSADLLSGKYIDQVMKNNTKIVFTSIRNNIVYNLDKYIYRLLKFKFTNVLINKKIYFSLIKKCSTYEMYKNRDSYKKIEHYIEEINKNGFNIDIMQNLLSQMDNKLKTHIIYRSENNIFLDELKSSKEFEKELNVNKSLIKKIIIGEKDLCDFSEIKDSYKQIYNEVISFFPSEYIFNNYSATLEKQPFKFIKSMIQINNYLEQNNVKTFNVFPKIRNLTHRNICFDAASINVIFLNNRYNNNILDNINEIYQKAFGFDEKYFTLNKKYIFNGTIQTDGRSLSISYIPNNDVIKNIEKSKIKKEARLKKNKELFEIKNKIEHKYEQKIKMCEMNIKDKKKLEEEKDNIEIEKSKEIKIELNKYDELCNNKKKEKELKYEEKSKIYSEQYKDNIKKLKDENNDDLKTMLRKNKEFYNIEDLTNDELLELEKDNKMYTDLGKIRLFYGLYNNKFMKYTAKERSVEMKTNKSKQKIEMRMEKLQIIKIQEELKNINRKTTNKDKILNIIKKVNDINVKCYEKYQHKDFKQEKLQRYIRKQETENKMIKKIVEQLKLKEIKDLKNITLISGHWTGNNKLKNQKSTLGLGLLRIFKKYFKRVLLLNEMNTSIINNETHEKMECAVLDIKSTSKSGEVKIIHKRMHEILTYKSDKINITRVLYSDDAKIKKFLCNFSQDHKLRVRHNDEKEIEENGEIKIQRYVQRDKNAVINFKKITEYFVKHKQRPKIFTTTLVGRKPTTH